MSSHIKILSPKEILAFDNPPAFNEEERKKNFYVPDWARKIFEGLKTTTSKVGFILQCGYFKAVNKFFVTSKFHRKDIGFTVGVLELFLEEVNISDYTERTCERHQAIILKFLGWHNFDNDVKSLLMNEALSLCNKQTKTRLMFLSLVDFLRRKKIEVPRYYAISEIITQALINFEKNLITLLEQSLSVEDRHMLDELLKAEDECVDEDKKVKIYKLTLLKKSHQSTKPSKIKENVRDLNSLHKIFIELKPIIDRLDLSSELIHYYAHVVIKSKIFQMKRREENKYILLLAFVVHQFYQLNDVLIEILIQSVQTTRNSSIREHKEKFYEERQSNQRIMGKFAHLGENRHSLFLTHRF
ncbi:Transposase, Tn3 [Candidatus Magnetobacterium bavaricum]|uniref:Transposase, Tn3 n=1 Tax=Candidatus Magnetobacterium bavaricum TaxID=29290 RepID=A0A0F3GPM3_9BACT|nr:Transposase, Tn3 [Candidatus Magnetobacterium bavaricum]